MALALRCLALGCRRPPRRFWLGLALIAPIMLDGRFPFAEAWHSVFAAWGLWLCVDGLAKACQRPSLLGDQPDAAVWAIVISIFGWAGIEQLNEYFPVWTSLGFSFNPLAREIAIGLLGGAVAPTVLSVAAIAVRASSAPSREGGVIVNRIAGCLMISLIWIFERNIVAPIALVLVVIGFAMLVAPRRMWAGSGVSRHLALATGAFVWTMFDALWSQLGPAQRFFVDFSSPAYLPVVLWVCAFMLAPIYQASTELLDKPLFDPFRRG